LVVAFPETCASLIVLSDRARRFTDTAGEMPSHKLKAAVRSIGMLRTAKWTGSAITDVIAD
jgi:hypothetical protein